MDQPIRPRPSNLLKPRIRIVERRETVYEIRQPDYDVVRDPDGMLEAAPSGRLLRSTTVTELSTATLLRKAALAAHPHTGYSVPEEKVSEPDDHPDAAIYIKGWNHCRMAMLAAAPDVRS